jgi:molybdopterin/thiamine biosynthesis adenylyltransferase
MRELSKLERYASTYMTRHSDLIPASVTSAPIAIIGAGAIGSHVAMGLARMGFANQIIYDYDVVDEFNMGCQGYMPDDVGKEKTKVMSDKIESLSGYKIRTYGKYEGGIIPAKVVIAAADSMEARKIIWQNSKTAGLFVDIRMAAEYALIYTSAMDGYDKTLYTDAQAEQERCTAKATVYTAMLASGAVCKIVKDYLVDNKFTRSVVWDIKGNNCRWFNA